MYYPSLPKHNTHLVAVVVSLYMPSPLTGISPPVAPSWSAQTHGTLLQTLQLDL